MGIDQADGRAYSQHLQHQQEVRLEVLQPGAGCRRDLHALHPQRHHLAGQHEDRGTTRNGFPFGPLLITARIKHGGTELQALSNCTGSVEDWDLKCSTPDDLLGSFSQFSLTDEDSKQGLYESRVIAPDAPETKMNYSCTLAH